MTPPKPYVRSEDNFLVLRQESHIRSKTRWDENSSYKFFKSTVMIKNDPKWLDGFE